MSSDGVTREYLPDANVAMDGRYSSRSHVPSIERVWAVRNQSEPRIRWTYTYIRWRALCSSVPSVTKGGLSDVRSREV